MVPRSALFYFVPTSDFSPLSISACGVPVTIFLWTWRDQVCGRSSRFDDWFRTGIFWGRACPDRVSWATSCHLPAEFFPAFASLPLPSWFLSVTFAARFCWRPEKEVPCGRQQLTTGSVWLKQPRIVLRVV